MLCGAWSGNNAEILYASREDEQQSKLHGQLRHIRLDTALATAIANGLINGYKDGSGWATHQIAIVNLRFYVDLI